MSESGKFKGRLGKAAPFLILAAGIVLIVVGVLLGQPEDVFNKAVRVCLECIGVG